MKYLRYKGEFLSVSGVSWRAEIMQEADEAFADVGELTFPAETPLSIEWERVDKEEVICGSTATLKIVSPGDRTYEDLYTIEVGKVRLDVYRNNILYWSGCIDTEFYEEPYEQLNGYEVSLTFSDFGVLDRVKYDLTGMRTLREIVQYAISRTEILSGGIDATCVSTCFEDGTSITSGGLSVRSENFIDEDGEASTLYEAVEGILQPLAIRMVQRAGMVYLYDLNGLFNGESKAIEWDGDSQTMGTDKVANNVVVTFSPYSSSKLMSDDAIVYGAKYDVEHYNLGNDSEYTEEYGEYYSYYPDYSDTVHRGDEWDYNLIDFTIFISKKGEGLASIGDRCRYFHTQAVTGGEDMTGVAWAFRTGGHGGIDTKLPKWKVRGSVPRASLTGSEEVLTTNRVFIPKLDDESAKSFRVRVAEEILLDARYNPFSDSSESNDEGNDDIVKACSGFVFIPAKITLYDADGTALYHYSNKADATGATKGHLGWSKGKWVEGADPGGDCWLEYYAPDDLVDDAGIRGFKANRHCIGRPDGTEGRMDTIIYESFKKMDDGEYMVYPPVAGYLEVQIQSGVYGYDYAQFNIWARACNFGDKTSAWDLKGIYDKLRWCLYKAPVVDVVNYNLVFDEAELEDVEYSGYLNKAAKEEMSIDTVCGTADKVCPTAKGIYHRTSNGQQLQKLTRAGVTDHPEKLLIGTLYSQYASRKTTLTGEAVIDGGLHYYTEASQDGKRFMLMSDVQDLIMDCTEAEYCEFRPDEYEGIEEA